MEVFWSFVGGFVVGGWFGLIVMALIAAGKWGDDVVERHYTYSYRINNMHSDNSKADN